LERVQGGTLVKAPRAVKSRKAERGGGNSRRSRQEIFKKYGPKKTIGGGATTRQSQNLEEPALKRDSGRKYKKT